MKRLIDLSEGLEPGLEQPLVPAVPRALGDAGRLEHIAQVDVRLGDAIDDGLDFRRFHVSEYVHDCIALASTNARPATRPTMLFGRMSDWADESREVARAFMRQALAVTGLSPYALAKKAGVAASTITRPLNNPEFKFTPKQATLAKIGAAAALTPPKLPEPSSKVEPVNRTVPLVGEVRAGAWTEVPDEPVVEDEIPVFLPDYQRASLFALRVAGRSMDQLYQDGTIVIAAPCAEIGLQVGDIVVARRWKNGLAETTLKELVQEADGSYCLYPRSSDTSLKPIPLAHEPHNDNGAEVIGVVVYAISASRRGRGPLVTFG